MPFALDPEIGAALAAMGPPPPQIPIGDVKTRREVLEIFFKTMAAAAPANEDVSTQDFLTTAEDGYSIRLRWYTKTTAPLPGSAVCYAHGGGYIALDVDLYDTPIKRYVSRTGVPFLSVDYRLAPEVKAPVPVTDTYAGLKYLIDHAAELGVDPARIAIMGDSAGGGITASLAHYIKLKGGPAVKMQILIYPMLDDRNLVADPNIVPFATWSWDDNVTGWQALLGDKVCQVDVDPIEAAGRMTVRDARGLPPTYMDVGELDAFRDEDLEYVRKLGQAGVSVEFHLTPGAPHAYEAMAPEAAVSRVTWERRFEVIKSL